MRLALAALGLSALVGCAQQMQEVNDDEFCTSQGFETASPDYGQCMRYRQQERFNRASLALQFLQQRQMPAPYVLPMPQTPIYQPPRQTNCTTTAMGLGNYTTSCY